MKIGNRLKKIRKELGYTQTELAEKANMSRTYLADIEGNRYNPSLDVVKTLSEILGVSISDIIEDENETYKYIKVVQDAEKAGITPEKLAALIEFLRKE